MERDYSKINNVCLVILASVALTCALIYTRQILVPFVISLFCYAIFSPAVHYFQQRLRIPQLGSILLTIGLFLLIAASILFFIVSSVGSFIESAGTYTNTVKEFIRSSSEALSGWGLEVDSSAILTRVGDLPFFSIATSFTGQAVTLFGNATLVIIFVLFFLAGEGTGDINHPLADEILGKISRYVAAKFFISFVTAGLVGFILVVFGIKLAFMFAVLTFLLNFIPNFGSIVASILPMPVLLLQHGFGWQFAVVLFLLTGIQFLIGNVVEPKMMGESMELHPVTVLVFLMFWGLVWGIAGMFLAVPITAILRIVLSRIETTKPLAELLAGRLQSSSSV